MSTYPPLRTWLMIKTGSQPCIRRTIALRCRSYRMRHFNAVGSAINDAKSITSPLSHHFNSPETSRAVLARYG
jgi:hypothetical protein